MVSKSSMEPTGESSADELSGELSEESSGESSSDSTEHSKRTHKKVTSEDIFQSATKNDLDAIRYFVEEKDVPVSSVNDEDQTIAHIAAKNGNLTILKYLISRDRKIINVKDKWDQSVLHQAVKAGALEMVKYLMEQCKANPLTPKGKVFGDTCIHIAANQGKLDVLKYLLEVKKLDPNMRNSLGEPPIFLAAEKMQLDIVKYLCETHRADPTQVDNNQRNVLYQSAIKGDIEVPKYLLEERKVPLDVNWLDVFGQTILFVATRYNKPNYIKYMVEERKADMDIADKNGIAPIQEAANEGYVEIVKYFYEKGAKVDINGDGKNSLRKLAKRKELKEYLDLIAPTSPPSTTTSAPKSTKAMKPSTSSSSVAEPPASELSSSASTTEAKPSVSEPSSRRRRHVDVGVVEPNLFAPSWVRRIDGSNLTAANQIGESATSDQSFSYQGKILLLLASVYSKGRNEGQRELFLSPRDILENKMDTNAIAAVREYYAHKN